MKRKITIRLIITNLSILIAALLCFYAVSVYNLNTQAREQAEQQIIAESSTISERTKNMQDVIRNIRASQAPNIGPPGNAPLHHEPYIFPSQNDEVSLHILCEYDDLTGELVFPEEGVIMKRINIDEQAEMQISGLTTSIPDTVTIGGERYLALVSPMQDEEGEIAVVSLLAMNSVNALTVSNIVSFGIAFAILIAAAFVLIYWQAMKITAPLKMLTVRSKRYANRDYSEPFVVNTGDEIESLSYSIQMMVESIIAHEKSQTALFRNLSHELKTPLTAISGYAQNIQNGYYENTNVPLKIIQEECGRIRDILDNLIFLSKIDSHVEPFTFAPHDITKIVTSSVEKVESIAIVNDIDIHYEPPGEIIIACDAQKLVRAFINVLSNALKHTEDCIEIAINEHEDVLTITITDNGDGFTAEKLEKLFITATGESTDGNGIGLLIVHEIIKRHGGKIAAQNREHGAEVVIVLPRGEGMLST